MKKILRVTSPLAFLAASTLVISCQVKTPALERPGPKGFPAAPITETINPGTVLGAIWANDGGDKITQDERRATLNGAASVGNRVWNGGRVILFGARNEVVGFNLVLEAKDQAANDIQVTFNELTGPGGAKIRSTPATASGVFNWTQRSIELFAVRYLQIKGLSLLSYETYDERHIPRWMRRPFTGQGEGTGTWADRPDHDKFYPEIAVPLEAVGNKVSIAAGQNQSVWVDVYVPKSAPAGIYDGNISLTQGGTTLVDVPVQLTVRDFTLPDVPSAKTMVNIGYPDVAQRYTGTAEPNPGSAEDTLNKRVRDRHFLVAHRHKISLIDANSGSSASPGDRPRDEWIPRLNGSLFTAANGYDGPGVNTGNNVFSIGTYGSWGWKGEAEAGMRTHTNAWESWFASNSPNTERFLYLIDESTNYAQIEQWASWIKNNPGAGRNLPSFATISIPAALAQTPSLNIAASWFAVGPTTAWANAVNQINSTAGKKAYLYNGKRPSQGSFATEDEGVALRELAWAQYKKKIARWFFWEATYYNDYQGGRGQTNVFQTAATFSGATSTNASLGETGWNHSNGDGVLFYPGTDRVYASQSLGLEGPIASLRLKHWRRGIQDVDYLTMAATVNASATAAIVERMVPKAMWDYGITDPNDPTWVRTDISWSINPDDWEAARAELAQIIEASGRYAAAKLKKAEKDRKATAGQAAGADKISGVKKKPRR